MTNATDCPSWRERYGRMADCPSWRERYDRMAVLHGRILSVLILCSGDHCDKLLGLPFVDIMFDLCLCFVCVSCYHVMSV